MDDLNDKMFYVKEVDSFELEKIHRKYDIVQVRNPKTERYVKIDRTKGRIISHKITKGMYKNIPIAT